jgi:hypothetical protein
MAMTTALVCGGRNYADKAQMFAALDGLRTSKHITSIVHGAASGADRLAGEWAKARGIECTSYPADWKRLGQSAGPIRNQRMLENERPSLVIAFPGGSGTADMKRRAVAAGVEVIEIKS